MEEEAEPQEEPERPLKRLRIRYEEGRASPSSGGNSLKQPKSEEDELVRNKGKQPVLSKPLSIPERSEPSQPGAAIRTQLQEKGKEPVSFQTGPGDKKSFSERSAHGVKPGIVLSPKKLVHSSVTLIEPKDEPVTVDLPQFAVPLAVIPPGISCPLWFNCGLYSKVAVVLR